MEFEWDENKRIYWKELIDMLKQGLDIKGYEIDFRNEKIEFKDVSLLNRNGIRVPQELIYYNEDNIDFSDDPEVTDDEIKAIYITEALMVEPEIIAWIKKRKNRYK